MTASGYLAATARGIKTFAGDVGEGFFEITHNTLALLGIVVVSWWPCWAPGPTCVRRASSA